MSKQIAIIGIGEDRISTLAMLAANGLHDVDVVTPEEAAQMYLPPFENPQKNYFRITDIPQIDIYGEKSFVCKGLHEYRKVETKEGSMIKVEWICQCGRKTTD